MPFFQAPPVQPFFQQFQAAVARNDAKAAAQGAHWPMQWENGPIREIKSEAELAARFNTFFTAEIRGQIQSGKLAKLGAEQYAITWKARGNEYSLYFKLHDGRWVFDGLSEGPE
jgi:hypothetical protein